MNKLDKYAELVIKFGVNIQKDQPLLIRSTIETADFARLLMKHGYEQGACEVIIFWADERELRMKMEFASDEAVSTVPNWKKDMYDNMMDRGAAVISISATDPDLMKGIDSERLMNYNKAMSLALSDFREAMMADKSQWCVVSVPTTAWAKKMFPDVSEEEAMSKLWEAIYKAVRIDTKDPVQAWADHQKNLTNRKNKLNEHHFEKMVYKNSLGTNLEVRLAKKHIWLGGADDSQSGVEFFANMPTEEVFTMPDKDGVNGRLVSSMPLNYQGNTIEEFWFEFKDGKVVDYGAKVNKDVLGKLIDFDEGAKRLGEIALVDYDSPISNQNILFYNTLYDENASCHFAVGNAYPSTIIGGTDMSEEELALEGANKSLTHVDFMVGTSDLSIVGVKADGKEVVVFKDGNLVL